MRRPWIIATFLVVQVACASFFVWDILVSVLGLTPLNWNLHEVIEVGAAVGLILGVVWAGLALRTATQRVRRVEDQLKAASGAFHELLEDRFQDWALTRAERDVALFAIKGMSTAEIAQMRNTSEGTVKAQTNAIYRKAGVSGRPQLLSLFIDELMEGPVSGVQPATE